MMKIIGVDGLTDEQINFELEQGAKFVVFEYCISVVIMTFRRGSDVYFIRPGESAVGKSLPYIGLSLLLGWWGIPWGPIYTISSLVTNFKGGKDVTMELIASVNEEPEPAYEGV